MCAECSTWQLWKIQPRVICANCSDGLSSVGCPVKIAGACGCESATAGLPPAVPWEGASDGRWPGSSARGQRPQLPLPPRGAPRNCFQCRSQPGFNSLLPLDECGAHRWGVTPCDRQRPSFCHSKIKADNTDKPECHAINFKSLSSSEGKAKSSRCAAPSQVRGMPRRCSCNAKSRVEKTSHLGTDMKCPTSPGVQPFCRAAATA